jgi:hypothetical protein
VCRSRDSSVSTTTRPQECGHNLDLLSTCATDGIHSAVSRLPSSNVLDSDTNVLLYPTVDIPSVNLRFAEEAALDSVFVPEMVITECVSLNNVATSIPNSNPSAILSAVSNTNNNDIDILENNSEVAKSRRWPSCEVNLDLSKTKVDRFVPKKIDVIVDPCVVKPICSLDVSNVNTV